MKSVAFAVSALAAVATAQSQLPDCAQKCVNDMQSGNARNLNCGSGDFGCLCANPNYFNGLRDCTNEGCNGQDLDQVMSFAVDNCRNHGVQVNTAGVASGTPGPSSSGSATVATVFSTASSSGSVESSPVSSTTVTQEQSSSQAPATTTTTVSSSSSHGAAAAQTAAPGAGVGMLAVAGIAALLV